MCDSLNHQKVFLGKKYFENNKMNKFNKEYIKKIC